jgi:hypothetical protein
MHLLLTVVLFLTAAFPVWAVTEVEPNNTSAQANSISCGDTVVCATLHPWYESDYFRVHVAANDSIIAETFSCQGRQTNTMLVLYDDHDSLLVVNDDGGANLFSRIRYVAPRIGDYFVRVLRQETSADSVYNLRVYCPMFVPEAYDLCTSARAITALPYYHEGTTRGMTNQCGTAAPDVFYKYYNPVARHLYLTVCCDAFDARVQILGRCCGNFGDDASTGCSRGAVLNTNLAVGDWLIMVEGISATESGAFSLQVTAEQPVCAAPSPVVLLMVGGHPFLDWPQVPNAQYFIVEQCATQDGEFEHLGVALQTYYMDSSGYAGDQRFYRVRTVCPW